MKVRCVDLPCGKICLAEPLAPNLRSLAMLKIRCRHDAGPAARYFTQDSNLSAEERVGTWGGKLAAGLGLQGDVDPKDFLSLLHGFHPKGFPICARLHVNRRSAWEIVLSPDKSISIAALASSPWKQAVQDSFNEAVRSTFQVVESLAHVQVANARKFAPTKNVACAAFVHHHSRDGDPHIHAHLLLLNSTFDPRSRRLRSLEVEPIYKCRQPLGEIFDRELARSLQLHGIPATLSEKGVAIIPSVPSSAISRLSRANQRIETHTRTASGLALLKSLNRQNAINRINDRTRPKKSQARIIQPDEMLTRHELQSMLAGAGEGRLDRFAAASPTKAKVDVNQAVRAAFLADAFELTPKTALRAAVRASRSNLQIPLGDFLEAAKELKPPGPFLPSRSKMPIHLLHLAHNLATSSQEEFAPAEGISTQADPEIPVTRFGSVDVEQGWDDAITM